ncbi:hypothetical protein FRB90_003160 [Tulasnella sp. 427]|nr:hypothetical protein FRB90_003160 [Tulasnella sp. 427]
MDVEAALLVFGVAGSINSRASLDEAVSNLLETLGTADVDIVTLLGSLVNSRSGILEAVLTSRSNDGFAFRSRILKALQKSSSSPNPVFTRCAQRLGAFFVRLPPWINLDRSVMEAYNGFSAIMEQSSKLQKPEPATIQKSRPAELPSEDRIEDAPESPTASKAPQPPSPTIPLTPRALSLPEQLRGCLEVGALLPDLIFFTACVEESIEDHASNSLILSLTSQVASKPEPLSPIELKQMMASAPVAENPAIESFVHSSLKPQPYLNLEPTDIARYLENAASSNFGDWPVVVSQRGIKHLRQYIANDKEVFRQIENKLKQLSVGFFSLPNHTKLLQKDFGISIYTADLGGDLYLVYHIDFGAPTGTSEESQFIRIFGVFSTSNIDASFWKSVAAHLARRGPDYIQRCSERSESTTLTKGSKKVKITPPKLFPPLDVSHWNQKGADVEIDESHFLELHRILALEKFVPLSRTFFDAIQKYDETSFMFAVSSPEYNIIRHPSSCLVLGRSGTGKTTCMLFRMIGLDIATEKSGQPLRQMFVTQSRTLARRVRSYCMQLRQTEANEVGSNSAQKAPGLSLLEMDESAEEEGLLPKKFSELEDAHFPLFLTYDQLCTLLEADFGLHFNPSALQTSALVKGRTETSVIRQPLVSFEYFESTLWPHFDERIKKGLHAALVYSEFMGIIKGSEASLGKQRRYLDRNAYETQSNRTHSGDDTERFRIYTLFEAYQKQRPSSSYDIADRVHALMDALQAQGFKGRHIDFLYVDEAQDNLIVDAALLRSLCHNPHGLFFAGDTAQTISVGSAFRFSELKAFLYRLERDDPNVKTGRRREIDPHFFQLSTNYRSHSGIVNVAAFVVKLLDQYFPHSIDSLTPEVSLVDVSAHKPVFFSGREDRSDFLRLISDSTSGRVELGAHQVIIVRDETAAKRLEADIGRVAVILTLYESKGMEFDDVLLYDFFTDSTATATDWRAVLLSQHADRVFDERKHSILQSELKSFYVGLTRARERVWIWDRSRKGQDMETLLTTSLLATAYDTTQTVPQLGVSSSSEEWSKQAEQYFSKRLFGEAAFCFKKAGEDWWASVSLAYGDRQVASRLPEKHPRRLPAFAEVARNFDRLAQLAVNSEAMQNARLLYLNAAECFAILLDHEAAATAYRNAHKFTEAAYHYRRAGMFDDAIDVITCHKVDENVATSIKYAAKFVYARRRDEKSLHKAFKICEGKEDFISFLTDHGFEEQRILFLESITEHEEIGDVQWQNGDHLAAIARFRRSTSASSKAKATECLLDGLRSHVTFGSQYAPPSTVVSRLFSLGRDLQMDGNQQNEFSLFGAVINSRAAELLIHGRRCFDGSDTRGALLALDAWMHSKILKSLEHESIDQVADMLRACRQYCTVVKLVVQRRELFDKPPMQRLFGISSSNSGTLSEKPQESVTVNRQVEPQSFIYTKATRSRELPPRVGDSPPQVAVISKDTVDDMICHSLLLRLNSALLEVHHHALKSSAFELCTRFLNTGRCIGSEEGRCWRGHPKSHELTIQSFNSRVRIHFLIIALLDQFAALPEESDAERNRAAMQRIWLNRLFETCYPSTTKTGNLSDITPGLIPDYNIVIPIVKSWLQEVFLGLRPSLRYRSFLSNLLVTSMLATAIDYIDAVKYLWHGQWFLDKDVAAKDELLQKDGRPVAGAALTWFARNTPARHNLGVYTIEHIVNRRVAMDVDVAVAYIEEVCGQLILNNYRSSYEGMTMPRTWIIRALLRGSSRRPNGSMPFVLISALSEFMKVLSGDADAGYFQVRGGWLSESATPVSTITRLCRSMSLLGLNVDNEKLQAQIMRSFQQLNKNWMQRMDFYKFGTVKTWNDVIGELQKSMSSSTLDELITVTQTRPIRVSRLGVRQVFCIDDKDLLRGLLIGDHIPLAAPSIAPKQPETTKAQEAKPGGNKETEGAAEPVIQMEGVDYKPVHREGASTIQAFFRRHRRRDGGPIALAFEELAQRRQNTPGLSPPGRFLLLCLRGPLPHVLAYLNNLNARCQTAVTALNKEMHHSKHEALDELHSKAMEIRNIRDAITKLLKELQPSSEFYCSTERSKSPASVPDIVAKVETIPNLVLGIRKFIACPEDKNYELGIEPLLSTRVPWAPKKATVKKSLRPALNAEDLDGYEEY